MRLFKTIFILALASIITNTAYWASVDKIDVKNSNEMELSFSPDVNLSNTVSGDVKVLKDISVSFATRDINDNNKVILTLDEDLNIELVNEFQPQDQGIVKIVTIDERTLEVYFKNPVEDTEFEFKIFSELSVKSLTYNNEKSVQLTLEDTLTSYSQYMLMILSLQDATNKNISFDEELYNFEISIQSS